MKNIAIITARSGSKGLKDKNIKLLLGKPMLAYSIEAAIESCMFETVMVSTDSEQYASIAKEYGADVPFLRSIENSGDKAGSWDVVKETLHRYLDISKKFDTVCLLQPTSPLRTASDIFLAYEMLSVNCADAITSVCKSDHPIQYYLELDDSLSLRSFRDKTVDLPRQKLGQYYRINGAIYIRKILYNCDNIELIDHKELAFVMSRKNSVDIDTIDDFDYAEFLLNKYREA